MPVQFVFLIAILILCTGAFAYFKYKETQGAKSKDKSGIAETTAQQFVNVKDVSDNCLYTLDGNIFAFLHIDGVCLELYTDAELMTTSRSCAAELSKVRFEWKYLAVSRPVDVKHTLQIYNELYLASEGGKRALLKHEIEELANMVSRGDTLERQHYIAVWGKENEKEIIKRADELAKIFSENKLKCSLLKRSGIVSLCQLVNIPAYAHIEDNSSVDTAFVSALMKG